MKIKMILILEVMSVLIITSCLSPTTPTPCNKTNISFQTLYSGYRLGAPRENLIITNQTDYDTYFSTVFTADYPVDFSSKIVIAIKMGGFMQSDYQIKVENVKSNCESITVNILEMNFNTCSGSSLPGSSMPIHIITTEKTILPINFVYLGWDNDADGFTTTEEVAAGTDPCNFNSHP